VAADKLPASALGPEYYPPSLTGIRGSNDASFKAAHAVAREGRSFPIPREQTEATYDLVVVGGGISGLSAAKFFRDRHGSDSRILVLDNHDDFGGHARRNELDVDGKTLIGYGGSQTLDTPSAYSEVAAGLLKDLGIQLDRFYDYFDQDFFSQRGLGAGMYFDQATFGKRALTGNPLEIWNPADADQLEAAVRSMPISPGDQDAFIRLLGGGVDYLQGKSVAEKDTLLRNTSYLDYLERHAGVPASVREILRDTFLPMVGVGWEAASAWEALQYSFPGTDALGLAPKHERDEPYIHHFPDGNASVARLLVRDLIPDAMPGSTMEDLVTARAEYAALDREGADIRLRLNSTAVDVRHSSNETHVDVTYINGGNSYRVRGRHVVMACYNQIIPHICPELPAAQSDAIGYATKIPFVIGSFALRNWQAFADAGYRMLYSPGDVLFKRMSLDFPVSMGGYQYPQNPDEPMVVSAWHTPTVRGLPAKDQYRAGRAKLLQMSYQDFESDIFGHFDAMLGPHGFDAERDIAAITLNRWPHGYAYEFEGVGVPAEYNRYNGPHIAGRARLGRISIANSDSEAYAYVDGAIDAADRAVNEQLAL
jgi:spermidine dehydrogenase